MRAVRVHEYGGPEVMRVEQVALPALEAGQVRVKIEAAGVNFIDVYQRSGQYKGALPLTLGMEAAGIVDAVGPGVSGVQVGDRVAYAMQQGSYAEYVVIAAERLAPVPAEISSRQAAAVMLQGMTAHYLAYSTYPLHPGDVALVHAAAGGVGLLLTQIAKRCGAYVIGTVSTPEKAELARGAGADEVILYTQEDFSAAVRRITSGAGAAVVYDSVGKTTFEGSLNCLRPRGYLVLFGQSSGAVPPFDPQILNAKGSLFLTRPSLGHYLLTRDELVWRTGDLFSWMAAGELQVRVDATYPLDQAGAAQQALASRATSGKLLLVP